MEVKTYAAILMAISIMSMILMGYVIKRQLQLFRLYVPIEVKWYRTLLFILAVSIFIGNIAPVLVDGIIVFGVIELPTRIVNPIGLIYTLDIAVTLLLSSVLIFWLYIMSNRVDKKL